VDLISDACPGIWGAWTLERHEAVGLHAQPLIMTVQPTYQENKEEIDRNLTATIYVSVYLRLVTSHSLP
jgi:hypothetical protein